LVCELLVGGSLFGKINYSDLKSKCPIVAMNHLGKRGGGRERSDQRKREPGF
jgi:hypothetical protein